MLARLRELLGASEQTREADPVDLRLAAAALLVEVARSDYQRDNREDATVNQALQRRFGLETAELEALVARAETESRQAVGLYPFTSLLNEECSAKEKVDLIRQLWEVAAADGDIDKYEEHLIRRVSDLLYVSHSDFIRAKLEVLERVGK